MRLGKVHLSSSQIIILGFFLVIMAGALLLMLPISTVQPGGATFMEALFTSTSATCVTGLVVQDTATYWTPFGQFVIMLLIQIGGMGVVTVVALITMVSGRKIGLMQRSTMQDAISAPQVGGIVRMTGFIVKVTLYIELIGAVLMAMVFCPEFGLLKGLWYGLFHSVSAFCNAGFDLLGVKAPFSSLTSYVAQPIINLVIMSLIVIGGIGFFTWNDIKTHGWRLRKYRAQSKVILAMTSALILLPAVYFFFFEFSEFPLAERIWSSFFQSVTPRTAGFNTVDLTAMSETGQLLTVILMLIGGSPSSTAGGMKTTTVGVLLLAAVSVFRQKDYTHTFGRRISDSAIRNAATIFLMYIALFLLGGMIISRVDNIPILTALYETSSAIGTVGLTLGVTPQLGLISRIILVLLMYFGRVGGLTLMFAAFSRTAASKANFPEEKITVG